MADYPMIQLNDGRQIPQIGFGVFQIPNDQVVAAMSEAFAAGYRSIDTAAIYRNEEGVGAAIASATLPREEIFVTTKLWNDQQGYDSALRAMDESLKRLQLDYVDLYLIHWPAPTRDAYVDSWRALIRLREEGLAKSIGVSNFTIAHLERLLNETDVVPAVNQIELHPRFQQRALREFHGEHGIATESWSPLAQAALLQDETIRDIAQTHGKTSAQVILRWHIQNGLIVIPKSATPARIRENIDIFDFELNDEELARIAQLDSPEGRIGGNPETVS